MRVQILEDHFTHHVTVEVEGRQVEVARPYDGRVTSGTAYVFPKATARLTPPSPPRFVDVDDSIIQQIRQHPNF